MLSAVRANALLSVWVDWASAGFVGAWCMIAYLVAQVAQWMRHTCLATSKLALGTVLKWVFRHESIAWAFVHGIDCEVGLCVRCPHRVKVYCANSA